jgi:hypothetical protein
MKTNRCVGDVPDRRVSIGGQIKMILEPAHLPLLEIAGSHNLPGAVAPVEDGEASLQPIFWRHHSDKRAWPGLGSLPVRTRSPHAS